MTSSSSFAALECRVGLGRASIATDAIDVLAEYSVARRLPLTDRISYSVGVWQDEIVLSLSLARVDSAPMRTTTGLVLATPGAATAGYLGASAGNIQCKREARGPAQRWGDDQLDLKSACSVRPPQA